jgi:diguanylate cyclase (GGDEF)-like protein
MFAIAERGSQWVDEIKIVIADDHEASRKFVRRFLASMDGISVVAEASDGEDLVKQIVIHQPNLVLVDISMPKMNGIKAIKECLKINPELKVIFITGHNEYAVEAFDISAVDYIMKPLERNRLAVAVDKARSIIKMSYELSEALYQKEYIAYHDALSGLPNRRLFESKVEKAMSLASKHHYMIAVIFLDLDRFKHINESMGHTLGDLMLQQVAERLQSCVRDSDIISRQGGDEFTILLNRISQQEDVIKAVQRIFCQIQKPFYLNGHEIHTTGSMGISLFPNDGQTVEDLMKQADTALNRAKEMGRNNYKFYTAEMNESISKKMILEAALRKALEREEFLVYYQPQVSIATREIVGMEALIRWEHPELGIVSPAEFIPLAEETGLIVPIGEWVLRTACMQARQWQTTGHRELRLSVNLSMIQFHQEDMVQTISGILSDTGFNPTLLELEITESIALYNEKQVIDKLELLRELGIKIAIDDFGTGYSSLSYLKKFPISTLKIDKVFIRDIMADSDDEALIAAIISMANKLKFNVIAEGVETDTQLSFLTNLQCNEAQGYLFGKPLPAPQFITLVGSTSNNLSNIAL